MREPANGNKEVVDLLERWLAEARKGEMNYVGIAVCKRPNLAGCGFAGDLEKSGPALEAVEALHVKLRTCIANRNPPPGEIFDRADYATYNMGTASLTYDFLSWLVHSEMVRVRAKAPAPLKVYFYWGRKGDKNVVNYLMDRDILFDRVVKPSLPLIGAVAESKVIGKWTPLLSMRDVVNWSRDGQEVPKFKPTVEAVDTVTKAFTEPPVTITLREAPYWPHRNSNMKAWTRLAGDLKQKGERVVFLRDTAKAAEPLESFETYPLASTDIQVRCALYEHSKANLFVSNGPCTLGQFGTKPYLIYSKLLPKDDFNPGSPAGYKLATGIAVGEQQPWATPQQLLWWDELGQDTYPNLSKGWEFLTQSMEGASLGYDSTR